MTKTDSRMTVAQAFVRFLAAQRVRRDGSEQAFFAGVFGIFGHGNVAGIGEALAHRPAPLPLLPAAQRTGDGAHRRRFRQDAATGCARFACTSSIGPGATNMVTGAAAATINRLPVLLLPGDIFATRLPDPVLQQLESDALADVSVNDCFKPVSRYWDRINRAEQLPSALMEAMRVLTSPAETGAVTLALPQDVQAEACGFPARTLRTAGLDDPAEPARSRGAGQRAAEMIRAAARPLIVAGGGVLYSEATATLGRSSRRRQASRSARRRRGRVRCPSTARRRSARSASPARPPRIAWRAKRIWCSSSARG